MMIKRLFLYSLLLLSPLSLCAMSVSESVAVKKASSFMRNHLSDTEMEVLDVQPVEYEGAVSYYVIQFKTGWTLVAADDTSDPIIGYSADGEFSLDKADNMQSWLRERSESMRQIAQHTTLRSAYWDVEAAQTRASGAIDPIIKVNWNQGKPYNQYCPTINGKSTYAGCVAVAAAQAMSVHCYPVRPQGEFSYVHSDVGTIYINYDKEAAYDWEQILSGANSKQELARLLYHVGVSLKMGYGTDGSGTQTSYIPNALQRNFGYSTNAMFYSRESYNGDWKELLMTELKAGRAVCYSGHDPKNSYGHCFNIDGYDGSAFFHVNWGWGGANNGYFSLDALKDATMGMNYTASQGVVVGIQPPSSSDKPASEAITDILLEKQEVTVNSPAGTVVSQIVVVSNAKNPDFQIKVANSNPLNKTAAFAVSDENLVTKTVFTATGTKGIKITVTNRTNSDSFTKTFTINVVEENTTISNVNADSDRKNAIYDLNGVQVAPSKSGFQIENNKKVFVK